MTSKDAITAHVNWKLRIHALLSGKLAEKLDPSMIARDDLCELGKWIYGEARSVVPGPVHADLRSTHAEFHREASRIVGEFYAGRSIGLGAIEMDSPFGKLTTRIVGLLSKLNVT
jgi:methyl-accepting chemotaxis protein